MKTVFLRALDANDKQVALCNAIREPETARGMQRFEVDTATFAAVPRSPFAYWASERILGLFKTLPPFEFDGRTAKQGLATADDFRFVRGWWEPLPGQLGEKWFPFAKGGKFSPFYADVNTVVNWGRSGEEIKNNLNERGGVRSNVWMLRDTAPNFFFRPGLTWPLRGARFSAQAVPKGCVFSVAGKMAFVPIEQLEPLMAVFNSIVMTLLMRVLSDAVRIQFEVGLVQAIPIARLPESAKCALDVCAHRAWVLKRRLDTRTETSHAFTLPAFLQVEGDTLLTRVDAWAHHVLAIEAELVAIQAEINARCLELYGIDEADRRAITEGFDSTAAVSSEPAEADAEANEAADDEDEGEGDADTTSLIAELVSWAVGVAFGRFDVRLATGTRALQPEPEPFDPLPVCSPAMLTGDDNLPLTSAPASYPLVFPESGILVDDPGHPHDLTSAVRAVFDVVFGTRADTIWQEAGALLDPKNRDLRAWLSPSLFEYQIKRYSKSRRKAPIFWQLGVPSGRYSVWLYAHRLTPDSFFQLQNDVVVTKLAHEERQLTSLIESAGNSPSARERKEFATQDVFVEELRGLLEEVKRIAPLWNPTLDDGVVLTMAPLWRLVPQHKPWQKELKSKWDELCAGKYDWAHLAMHLWPERVVPKCATDRSLAIAHGLAEMFWVQDADGEWQLRATPTRPVEEIVRERRSPAVKAALKTLLEAPVPTSGNNRGRKYRTDTVAPHGGTL